MPKSKVIDVRPKKRKTLHKLEQSSTVVSNENPKKIVTHNGNHLVDKFRFSKAKSRGHGDKHFSSELHFGKSQWLIYFGIVMCAVLAVVLVSTGVHRWFSWRQAQSIKTPLNLPLVIAEDTSPADLFWGTYRPGFYFGLKHRSPQPLIFGLIWTVQDIRNPRFRHVCDSHDGVLSYNWIEHDGRNFGTQQIVDQKHIITVSFVKQSAYVANGDWTVRISAVSINRTDPPQPLSVIVYLYYSSAAGSPAFAPVVESEKVTGLKGFTSALGEHQIFIHPSKENIQVSSLIALVPSEEQIMETMLSGVGLRRDTNMLVLTGRPKGYDMNQMPNIWFHEVTVTPPIMTNKVDAGQIVMEVEYTQIGRKGGAFVREEFTRRLNELSAEFHKRFTERFPVDLSQFTERQANLSKISVSNLLGGLGYFYGSSLVQSPRPGSEPVSNWPAGLFTATPSRSMFPRGFLWDEGFHGLILARWDPILAMETVGHWLDLMNMDGWIPREVILGSEARSRVPPKFVVQQDNIANPPSLALVIDALMDEVPKFSSAEVTRFRQWSLAALPRLHSWYQWLNRTQAGPVPFSYRWRGRNSQELHQLNPLTLSSGLDDYPRASHPSDAERHLDLRCWMALFARTVARLASVVAQYAQTESGQARLQTLEHARLLSAEYSRWADLLFDPDILDQLHWSDEAGRYADYGLHTDAVHLQMPARPTEPRSSPENEEEPKPIRITDKPPTLKLVTSSAGYLSLFPLLLRILPPNSPRLDRILSELESDDIWTEHGLRSLSRSSPLYMKSNTKDDPPYWRGAIWINMNYLAVRSLRYYSANARTPTDVASRAQKLVVRLSRNLARTVLGELERTGYLWEQYDDNTGRGQRVHPFSGWTSLVALTISSDAY